MRRFTHLCAALALVLTAIGARAQEVALTLADADSLFVARNLEVLAARYNVSQADADIEQARVWANPVISLDENIYNRNNHRFFDFGKTSQQSVSIDQLISIAGQHSSGIKVAQASREVALAQLDDLLRTLRGDLHKTFVSLYFAQSNMQLYRDEIVSLRQTLDAVVTQVHKGNISQIEAARIQALLLSISKEQDDYAGQVAQLAGHLRVLLSLAPGVEVKALFDPSCMSALPNTAALGGLLADSLDDRADVRAARAGETLADAQLRQERAKAWPEVHITSQFDRSSGPYNNYFGLGFSIELPISDRNKGAIRRARAQVEQSRDQLADVRQKAVSDVAVARQNFLRSVELARTVSDEYTKTHIDGLFDSVTENYRKRNITLLEFVDFYNTYKDAMLQMASVRENVFLTAEDLNTAAGRPVVKY